MNKDTAVDQVVTRKNYITPQQVADLISFYDNINDSLHDSTGPRDTNKLTLGWQGCWDRSLHLEIPDTPAHQLIDQLKNDFGDFDIYMSSIRYLSAPIIPHSDIRSSEWLVTLKEQGYREGWIFLIPLSWETEYRPATAFLSCPAKLDEPLYCEMLDVLPNYTNEFVSETKNFSVREIIQWENPGDLIAWRNFQWHASCQLGKTEYTRDRWVKSFISVEVAYKS